MKVCDHPCIFHRTLHVDGAANYGHQYGVNEPGISVSVDDN